MVSSICANSIGVYGDVCFPLWRGIKEGCPLLPALFNLLYKASHSTLAREFPRSTVLAYVDDVAIVPPISGRCKEYWSASNNYPGSWAYLRIPKPCNLTNGHHRIATRAAKNCKHPHTMYLSSKGSRYPCKRPFSITWATCWPT